MGIDQPISKTAMSRRDRSRLKTCLPARIITLSGSFPIVLRDISLTGAQFEVSAHGPVPENLAIGETVLLQWHAYEKIGHLIWEGREIAGMVFEELVTPQELIATRDLQDRFQADGGLSQLERKAASSWVEGLTR